jgi:predicted ester cyclase
MATEHDVNRVHQFVDALNRGEVESVREYIAKDFFAYSPAADEPDGTEVYYDLISDFSQAFPDMRVAVDDLTTDGDLIKGRLSISGTNTGPLWGAPPSGNSAAWDVDIALRPIGDRFAVSLENVAMPEVMGVLRQINLVPPPDKMDQPMPHPIQLNETMIKVLFTGQVADKPCSHLDQIKVTEPTTDVCESCVAKGDIWPALRMCLICGFIGCCDTSKNKHMKAHYEETGHPIFRSIRLDEGWIWCYEDNAFFSKRTLAKYQ